LDALRFSLSCGSGGTRRFGLTKRKQKQQVVVKMRVNTAASCACFSRATATTESNMELRQNNQNKTHAKNVCHGTCVLQELRFAGRGMGSSIKCSLGKLEQSYTQCMRK
jgi:hypothetical protein